jgi:malonyl-CoA O-methyltransferase
MRVSPLEAHRIWSRTYDREPNPLLALDMRVLGDRLGALRGLRVVDVACGTGRWMAAAHAAGANVFGVDLCGEMLAGARAKPGVDGRLILAHSGRIPLADGIADLVLCSFAVNYLPSAEDSIAEMARITRPGGRVVMSDLHPLAIANGWKRSFRVGESLYEIDHHTRDFHCLNAIAVGCALVTAWRIDARFGIQEREIFCRAGKATSFVEASRLPALEVACWTRR